MNLPGETQSGSSKRPQRCFSLRRKSSGAPNFARILAGAGPPGTLGVRGKKKAANAARNAILRCACSHSKSIHVRMYANQKLGTACNFPFCRCKAYKPQ